jgi:basic membrane protein A
VGVAKLVMSMRTAIIKGDMHPFVGPIYDQAGNLKYAEGEIPSDGDLLSMDWFINNVVGKIQ